MKYQIEMTDETGKTTGFLYTDTLKQAEVIVLNRKMLIDTALNLVPNNNRYAMIWEEK